MIFAPVRLDTALERGVLAVDRKNCKRFGNSGIGEQAIYLAGLFLDRHYYIPFSSVHRVFKRVAMSRGGFTGKGVFGSIPYLVVEYGEGQEKQCSFKREEDVDLLLSHLAQVHPEIPRLSAEGERRLAEKAAREAKRFCKVLTHEAQAARDELEQAQALLLRYPEMTARLSAAARAKRTGDRANPAYKWVALAIVLAGIAAAAYGIYAKLHGDRSGLYFLLLGFAAVFLFSGSQVLPTAKNNRRALERAWESAQSALAEALPRGFPLPARYAHPAVLARMIRILREGRAQSSEEALAVLKSDLRALNADVQVEQEEYDEIVAIKPMFLLSDYR